jgi:hypothetical protein
MRIKSIAILICLNLLAGGLKASETITLTQALQKNMITLKVHGRDSDEIGSVTYYGKCISFDLRNLTGKSIKLKIVPGQVLTSLDSATQDMMITETLMVTLMPLKSRKVNLYAMCAQKSNAAPAPDDNFILGEMAEEDTRKLAEIIDQKRFQDNMGQSAVWVMTDDASLESITGSNADDVNYLRKYVATAKGLTYVPYGQTETIFHTLSGQFDVIVEKEGTAKLVLEDEQGYALKVFFENRTLYKGNHKFNINAKTSKLAKGIYYMVLYLNGKAIEKKVFRL